MPRDLCVNNFENIAKQMSQIEKELDGIAELYVNKEKGEEMEFAVKEVGVRLEEMTRNDDFNR